MGTYYRVLAYCDANAEIGDSQSMDALLAQQLVALNATFSNYDSNSELMRFNQADAQTWHALSPELLQVLQAAQQVHGASEGALDISVAPLVGIWGFGPNASDELPPSEAAIARIMQRVGQQHLQLDPAQQRALKSRPLELDLSAIAKGYAVDKLSEMLKRQGCPDHLVDIGGEVRAMGLKPSGEPWRVGIEVPNDSRLGEIARALPLHNQGIATSGDYRNFIQEQSARWSHTIDPRSGAPVRHRLASVTVVLPTTQLADAWATAFTVMGADAALAYAEARSWPVLTIERHAGGVQANPVKQGFEAAFEIRYTEAMAALLTPPGEVQP